MAQDLPQNLDPFDIELDELKRLLGEGEDASKPVAPQKPEGWGQAIKNFVYQPDLSAKQGMPVPGQEGDTSDGGSDIDGASGAEGQAMAQGTDPFDAEVAILAEMLGQREQRATPQGWDPLESTCRHASLSIL